MLSEPSRAVGEAIPQAIQEFCELEQPYLINAQRDQQFIDAMQAVTRWHIKHSPWYRQFAQQHDIQPDQLNTLQDLIALPPVHANFFKAHAVRSITEDQIVAHMTSSGTTGQKSQMFFDEFTIAHAREMVKKTMAARGVVSDTAANYLVNAYEPFEGFKVGTSKTNQLLMQFAPVADQFWTLRYIGGTEHQFDSFGAIATLQHWQQGERPVRIIGFPAFLHFIIQRMKNLGMPPLQLPADSWVIFGGGWKGHADQAISREAMRENIEQYLGIPAHNVVETFGSVEHSVPYISSSAHRLHQPVWSRVVIRDVKTLQPVPYGEPGFLSFISPYITSVPAHSVLMGDMAVAYPAGGEPGQPNTPWFEVIGRAGVSANKSCAAAAAEMLK